MLHEVVSTLSNEGIGPLLAISPVQCYRVQTLHYPRSRLITFSTNVCRQMTLELTN